MSTIYITLSSHGGSEKFFERERDYVVSKQELISERIRSRSWVARWEAEAVEAVSFYRQRVCLFRSRRWKQGTILLLNFQQNRNSSVVLMSSSARWKLRRDAKRVRRTDAFLKVFSWHQLYLGGNKMRSGFDQTRLLPVRINACRNTRSRDCELHIKGPRRIVLIRVQYIGRKMGNVRIYLSSSKK